MTGILDPGSVEDRREAQRSIRARLEQIRDDCDQLLDDDQEPALEELEGVIFGVADSDLAEARVTQPPGSRPPASIRILGELLDGLANSAGRDRTEIAAYVLRMMDESQARDDYQQTASSSRRQE